VVAQKILFLCSCLDLEYELGATPAWWQLLKALQEEGIDIIATTFRGRPIKSLWWRCYENPCYRLGETYNSLLKLTRKTSTLNGAFGLKKETLVPKLSRSIVKPRWSKHLRRILTAERDVDAVVFLGPPLNQLNGLASRIKSEFGVPVVYYDGDLPVSLPTYGGYTFNFYVGADLSEYDLFIANSEGAAPSLKEMGAGKVEVMHYGVDPEIFSPLKVKQDIDVFFSGIGAKFRERWINEMIAIPSSKMTAKFVISGLKFDGMDSRLSKLPFLAFSQWIRYCRRTKLALNIARDSHALTPGTSSSRPFELASLQCCVVSNPYSGLGNWFRLGKEMSMMRIPV